MLNETEMHEIEGFWASDSFEGYPQGALNALAKKDTRALLSTVRELQRQVQERDKRIKLKRNEIAAEVRSYDAQTSVQNSWRADRQRMLDWLDGLLEGEA